MESEGTHTNQAHLSTLSTANTGMLEALKSFLLSFPSTGTFPRSSSGTVVLLC